MPQFLHQEPILQTRSWICAKGMFKAGHGSLTGSVTCAQGPTGTGCADDGLSPCCTAGRGVHSIKNRATAVGLATGKDLNSRGEHCSLGRLVGLQWLKTSESLFVNPPCSDGYPKREAFVCISDLSMLWEFHPVHVFL